MRVYLKHSGPEKTRRLTGPADLQGLSSGVVLLEGAATDDEVTRWGVSLGLFAARGGEVRRIG